MTLVCFDAGYAAALGHDVRRIDLMMMALVMAVTVIGLKLVGLILIVALLIIPAVTARFWTERAHRMTWIAGAIGGISAYAGAAISAAAPALPTGPIIVLVAAGMFTLSLFLAPVRGLAASMLRRRRFQVRVHRRQGLLSLSRQEAIREPFTLRLLAREGLIRPDGVPTEAGLAQAAKVVRDECRWAIAREVHQDAGLTGRYDGLTPIEDVFTPDEIRDFDRRLGTPSVAGGNA
jgi:manganese/zinc/iron transport system permease protein